MFDTDTLDVETAALTRQARQLEDTPAATLAQVRARADAWRRLQDDPELARRNSPQTPGAPRSSNPKHPSTDQGSHTTRFSEIVENPDTMPTAVLATVQELAQQYRFFHWHLEFPGIFTVAERNVRGRSRHRMERWVLLRRGKPTLGAREDTGQGVLLRRRPKRYSDAKTAAIRGTMIHALRTEDPALYGAYRSALRQSDGTAHLMLRSGRYPLTGQGDVNTYSVFAETFRTVTAPTGAAGVITPTGLATDKTTAPFFADTLSRRRLIAFYDFENEAKIFPGVHHSYRFAVTADRGHRRPTAQDPVRVSHSSSSRYPRPRFELAAAEVLALNPNTGTLPMFRAASTPTSPSASTDGTQSSKETMARSTATMGTVYSGRSSTWRTTPGYSASQKSCLTTFNGWSYESKRVPPTL